MTTKPCRKCGVDQPLDNFYRHAPSPGGRRHTCRTCALKYARRYFSGAIVTAAFDTRLCLQCAQPFQWRQALGNRRVGRGQYCSRACYTAAGRTDYRCEKCGATFGGWKSVPRRFCSLECAGRVATARTLTKGQSLYSRPHWRRQLRQLVLDRDGHLCQRCEATRNLVVHHISPWRISRDNSLTNLVTVCRSCHAHIHGVAAHSDYVPLVVGPGGV